MKKPIKKADAILADTSATSKEIVANGNTIVNFNVESLMAKAIEHGLSPETMEKFLAMRQQLKAEWAKEQYNKAMAAFQADCPTIQKTKEVKTKSGVVAYRYAPIESIVQQVAPYLHQNGFSYSTNMELLEAGVKVSVKTTHIDGHSETSEMSVPLGNKTDIMSQSQVVAAAQTFAKRYAFCNAFGILTGDEDTDARPIEIKPIVNVERGGNTPGIAFLDESEKRVSIFNKDLEDCDTYDSYLKVIGEIKIAKENGKLSDIDYEILVKVCKKIITKFQPKEEPKKEISPQMQKMQEAMEKAKGK